MTTAKNKRLLETTHQELSGPGGAHLALIMHRGRRGTTPQPAATALAVAARFRGVPLDQFIEDLATVAGVRPEHDCGCDA